MQATMQHIPGNHATANAILDNERGDIPLFVDSNMAFENLFVHGVEDRMARAVCGITRAWEPGAAKGSLGDPSALIPAKDHAHAFEFKNFARGLTAHGFDRVLIA